MPMGSKTKEERFQAYKEEVDNFTIMDDTFMVACFRNQPDLLKVVLRIIMDKPSLEVTEITV